jgi:hypothetical protein
MTLMFVLLGLVGAVATHLLLKRENRIRDQGLRDEVILGSGDMRGAEKNGVFQSIDEARLRKGDEWSGFRYMV